VADNDDLRRMNCEASEEEWVRSSDVPGSRREPRLIDSIPWIASRIFGDVQLCSTQGVTLSTNSGNFNKKHKT